MADSSSKEKSNKLPRVSRKALLPYLLIFVAAPTLTFIIGKAVDQSLNLPRFPSFPYNLISGFIVFFTGLAIGIKSTRLLYFLGRGLPWGDVRQQAQATKLVTSGLYAYTRNPMTLGYSLLPCGMGLMFQSPAMTLFIPALVLTISIVWLKTREERRLEQRFGEEYVLYRKRTPFLIPHPWKRIGRSAASLAETALVKRDKNSARRSVLKISYIGISMAGLFVLALLAFSSNQIRSENIWDRQLSLAVFMAICVFGIVAGLHPSRLQHSTDFRREQLGGTDQSKKPSETTPKLEGHHPTCQSFSSHVLKVKGKPYCAGCTGLVLGATVSIAGSLLDIFNLIRIEHGTAIFWLGTIAVVFGLFQYSMSSGGAVLHTVLNVSFVSGAFLLVVVVIEVSRNPFIEMFALFLSVFLIISRITLSQLEHDRICSHCNLESCSHHFH